MSKKINEEIVSETEDRPTLKAVNELTAEDVAIKEYLKAVYKTKSKHEVEQLSRQLWNEARASAPAKSEDQAIAEFRKDLNRFGVKARNPVFDEAIDKAARNLFKAGEMNWRGRIRYFIEVDEENKRLKSKIAAYDFNYQKLLKRR